MTTIFSVSNRPFFVRRAGVGELTFGKMFTLMQRWTSAPLASIHRLSVLLERDEPRPVRR